LVDAGNYREIEEKLTFTFFKKENLNSFKLSIRQVIDRNINFFLRI